MAKKKRKYLIRLNNKIRKIFDGNTFEEGIGTLSDDRLMELSMLLELDLAHITREDMIRTLRRSWSEGGHREREDIVRYLRQSISPQAPRRSIAPDIPADRVELILSMLDEIEHTGEEEELILEAFAETRRTRITPDAIRQKLGYLRLRQRQDYLEEKLDVTFTTLGEMEFYHKYTFALPDFDINKYLLTKSEPLDIDGLFERGGEDMLALLLAQKEKAIAGKSGDIERFLSDLGGDHKWLDMEQASAAIKAMPPETDIYHIPIPFSVIEKILMNINPKIDLFESGEHFIIQRERSYDLWGEELRYFATLSYSRAFLYKALWSNEELPVVEDLHQLKEETESHFLLSVEALYDQLAFETAGLDYSEEQLKDIIVRFVAPQIQSSMNLKIKDKTKRRILYHFNEEIKPLKEKKLREELLAKTIRDFKNLFPLARSLKRKITFHVGPTNSGKTYAAMEKLRAASTGYYLAPLRLLALEGYESLSQTLHASLITGEEEIIDEESTHISSTIEMMNLSVDVDVCVIDEIQMIDDRDRGWAWANALIGAPAKEVILTGSSDALSAVRELCEYLGEELEVVAFERKNPLEVMSHPTSINDIGKQTAIVAFSRKEVLSLKLQLASRYNVSVVYGNLSPEVRREEARRFRHRESDILVATDAIAMGLNLPIRTILFAKDNKFDGLRRRELATSEILQIAGRAGRYGIEEQGFVGALDSGTLKTITGQFHKPLRDIRLPVSVMASLEHVMLIGEILETDDLLHILTFFAENMEFDGPFQAANIDSMMEIASIVGEYQLDLKTRYYLSCAPASISSPYIESVFHRYIRQLENDAGVQYIPPRDLPAFAQTNDMLLNAEDRVREISLYLWLSFKFPDHFQDTELAIESRVRLNRYIENSLKKGHFTKKCSRCGKLLDFSYRFSICDECHTKGKRGESSYRGRNSRGRGERK